MELKKSALISTIIFVFLIIAVVTSWYFYAQWKRALNTQYTGTSEEVEIQQIVSIISQRMLLPEGEDPTIATVIDKNQLRDQDFFATTENGDKVLIYTNARKAILYRPSTEMIINVAPIFFEEQAQ